VRLCSVGCRLAYNPDEMDAPILVAKGVEEVAAKIRELADEHKIPIIENPPLARALNETVDIDDPVPPQHYKAVAEIISYVFKLKGKRMSAANPPRS
jgi:Flagellar biosynthesis pathway, component FlhB